MRGQRHRWRAGATEEAGTGLGQPRRGERSDHQPGGGRDDGDEDVLGEAYGRNQARRNNLGSVHGHVYVVGVRL